MELLLASKSPRRRELLSALGYSVGFIDINVDETLVNPVPVERIAESLALRKSQGIDSSSLKEGQILVTADTVVVCNGQVLGKPHNEADARRMLLMLSGNVHTVYTGVCLKSIHSQKAFTESTNVWFKNLSDDEIDFYIQQYRPFDKAGAYGIQEWIGMIGINKIEGCYYNVMGLPLARLYQELQEFSANTLSR